MKNKSQGIIVRFFIKSKFKYVFDKRYQLFGLFSTYYLRWRDVLLNGNVLGCFHFGFILEEPKLSLVKVHHDVCKGNQIISPTRCLLNYGILAAEYRVAIELTLSVLDVSPISLDEAGRKPEVNQLYRKRVDVVIWKNYVFRFDVVVDVTYLVQSLQAIKNLYSDFANQSQVEAAFGTLDHFVEVGA